ncbi:MAG: protein kinase [Xanthomonadales bacterium]|jgi:serine/threonine-protein kinase|nr:protein kinase [Xanthomonadales bacterium]
MHTQVGHYQIVGELGRGGMGVVYKGYEAALQRHVAIKLMSEALAHQPEVVERFLREARAMGQLSDPHIVQIHFIGEHAGQPFFAMEFVEGETLAERLRRDGRIEPQEAAGLLMQAAQGLSVAHERGVIHRDIKPANLMLTRRGLLKVTDFGIALAQRDAAAKLTGTGQFVGTPGYLSPEVCLGHPIDARSDIFALGIVFFEMLAGRLPFTDASPLGMMLEVVQSGIPDIRTINAEVPAELVRILQRMLEKDPAQRYPDCEALIVDLQAVGATVRRTAAGAITPESGVRPGPVTPGLASTLPVATRISAPPAVEPPTLPRAQPAPLRPPPARPAPPLPPAVEARRSRAAFAVAGMLVLALVSAGVVAGLYRERLGQWLDRDARPVAGEVAPKSVSAEDAPEAPVRLSASPAASTAAPATAAAGLPAESAASADGLPVDAAAQAPSFADAAESVPDGVAAATEPGGMAANTAADAQLAEMRRLAAQLAEQTEAAKRAQAELEAARSAGGPPDANPVRSEPARVPLAKQSAEPRAPARPPAPPPMPAIPRVAVLAFGDPALAGPAELAVEAALEADGYVLADEEALPGFRPLMSARTPPLLQVLQLARQHGVAGIVLVRVNDLGTQTLSYYGQSSPVTSATIELAVHDVVARDRRARSTSETIQYTGLNAVERARQAVGPQLDGVLVALAPYRRGG